MGPGKLPSPRPTHYLPTHYLPTHYHVGLCGFPRGSLVGPEVVLSNKRFLLICRVWGWEEHRPASGTCAWVPAVGAVSGVHWHRGGSLSILGGLLEEGVPEG